MPVVSGPVGVRPVADRMASTVSATVRSALSIQVFSSASSSRIAASRNDQSVVSFLSRARLRSRALAAPGARTTRCSGPAVSVVR
ncbi:hypothetical protein SBADM41S_06749 [Streptomyces badius]